MKFKISKIIGLMALAIAFTYCSDDEPKKIIAPIEIPKDTTDVDTTIGDTTKTDTTIVDTTKTDTSAVDTTKSNKPTSVDIDSSLYYNLGDSINWAPIVIAYDSNMIDDFEDRDGKTALGGYWYSFANGGSQIFLNKMKGDDGKKVVVPNGVGHESKYSLLATYILDKADYEWAPYAAVGVQGNEDEKLDASKFQGIKFFHKGAKNNFRIETNAVTDYDFHAYTVPKSDEWQEIIISFQDDLIQEGWGKSVVFDPSDIRAFAWNIVGKTGDASYIAIDDIQFVDSITYEILNDMVIKEAVVPELDSIGDLSLVTTPVQEKAMKYLNKGVNLTNWLEAGKFDGTFKYNEATIKKYADYGFLGIRLPIDLDLYILDRDSVLAGKKAYKVDPLLFTPIDTLEAWTAKYGLSLTVDYHQYDGSLNASTVKNEIYKETVSKCWKTVAQHLLSNDREDIFFELTNEPGIATPVAIASWDILAKQMLDSIRTVDTKRTIIFGESRWYDISALIKFVPFEDKNVVYSFHFYSPFIFTHQAAAWADMGTTKNIPFPYSAEKWSTEFRYFGVTSTVPGWAKDQFKSYYKLGNKNAMMNEVIEVKNWAIENNVALICNEFGANPTKAVPEYLNNYFQAVTEIFEELEIAWQVWYGTFDNDGNLIEGLDTSMKLK